MEIRQLEFFVEVAKHRSFTRAAEELLVAQPAISKSIKKLEEELGLLLFNRAERKVSLTAEGEAFLKHAELILEQMTRAKAEMEEMRGLKKGEVRVGLPSMVGSYYFPGLIIDFKKQYPDLQITVYEQGTVKIQQMITQGEIDMGVVLEDMSADELEVLPFLKEEMVACVPASHPFARRLSVTYEELAHEPLVLFKEGYFQREIIARAGRMSGSPLNVTFETNQIPLIKSLVAKQLGITLFLRMVIVDDPHLVPVSLDPPVFLNLGIAWNKNAYLSKANQAFLSFLMSRIKA
ncbi:LysR family transcriptional regulator [Aneurinibacillus thermoaerophilus]|uniref:DNA-binding transcriptional regulator, LysR family n=1 Tax=Aneurinibacillus thermoaerophilus TaxID=143495 RepID=A0A1G8BYA1_ANETH|nr:MULTISPECIES: LysR family transcriptional regulator [Aneurinibacillus]AMA71984.1 LysR family transcriptional regulator [Aneurinibacillus sp. XH2]MED0675114.1 LysR family transcriptional regulator [Aneurinibacillus thermoaerophilus]MED0757195.1 LysR family transcriptional regulator [Aneurinibacillus thermoaerophilus]MED0762481.1 LysR family transcriptional regulator [Aneurinibacillus thermoaerophilus]QYY42247.1 LysR family transcriptional regulator [Aneurinibacillus thermoaerophilus]